jgi:hypothetical protein
VGVVLNGIGSEDFLLTVSGSRSELVESQFLLHERLYKGCVSDDEIDTGTWPTLHDRAWDISSGEIGLFENADPTTIIFMFLPI